MHFNSVLLYGANGYTGELIIRYAKEYGLVDMVLSQPGMPSVADTAGNGSKAR